MDDDFLIVVAIDFGTTYSGYAFSSIADYKNYPLKIHAQTWIGGRLVSEKCPTTVLFTPEGKFHSFGYDAEDKYLELLEEQSDVHKNWYLFRRFKMELLKCKGFTSNMELEDQTRKTMPAVRVFTAGIRFFVQSFYETWKKQNDDPAMDYVRWVLTVPAIWDDAAKDFMRKCAHKAGICHDKLVLCLEPEAASIYCKHLSLNKEDFASKAATFKPGDKYIVVDAGGGTVDISVHEVGGNFSLKEIHRPSGGAWGGTCVDDEFKKLLCYIFGEDTLQKVKTEDPDGMLTLLRDFEIKKRKTTEDPNNKYNFMLPEILQKNLQDRQSSIPSPEERQEKYIFPYTFLTKTKKLCLHGESMILLFSVIEEIIKHLKQILEKQECINVSHILLVGGFSDAILFQSRVKEAFHDKTFLVPPDAVVAVLKGAVMFGHNPSILKIRKCKYTYGVCVCRTFDEKIHPASAKTLVNDLGIKKCCYLFDVFVKIDQEISIDEHQAEHDYSVLFKDQTAITFSMYTSVLPDPMFVTDKGCKKIGKLTINIPETKKGIGRGATLKMKFSGTEIKAEAIVKETGERAKITLEFRG